MDFKKPIRFLLFTIVFISKLLTILTLLTVSAKTQEIIDGFCLILLFTMVNKLFNRKEE